MYEEKWKWKIAQIIDKRIFRERNKKVNKSCREKELKNIKKNSDVFIMWYVTYDCTVILSLFSRAVMKMLRLEYHSIGSIILLFIIIAIIPYLLSLLVETVYKALLSLINYL